MNNETIEKFREKIDIIDEALLDLITQRCDLAVEIGKLKQGSDQVLDTDREEALLQKIAEISRKNKLPETDIQSVWKTLLTISREKQKALYGE